MFTTLHLRDEAGDVECSTFCEKHVPAAPLPGELKREPAKETECIECWGIYVLGPMLRSLYRRPKGRIPR